MKIIPVIYANLTKKNILVKYILSQLNLNDLYPQIIKNMYNFTILRMLNFWGTDMHNIIDGLSYGKYFDSGFINLVCNEIDLRAIKLGIKTPENFLRFVDYCIILYLININGKLGHFNTTTNRFSKMIDALNFENNRFIIEQKYIGNFDATYIQNFYLERGIREVKTYYEYKMTTKPLPRIPEKYSRGTKKIYVMFQKAHPLIDKEIKRAKKFDIYGDILVSHLNKMKKSPVIFVCEKFVKENDFDYKVFVDLEIIKREETSTMN